MRKARKFIRRVSRRKAKHNVRYAKESSAWLAQNRTCEFPGCENQSSDVHHMRGRLGSLLLDKCHWMAVCRGCHSWIHNNIAKARDMGLIASLGEWNTKDAKD
jgi:hypothetical protein